MGGSLSNDISLAPTGRKKIVIIGASFGGKIMTNMLQSLDPKEMLFDILLIDKNEHFEYICANFTSLANETAWGENTIKFSEAIKSYNSDRVTFKQGKLTNVLSSENQIEISLPDGKTEVVPYDCLVIATGASYVSPWRGANECLTHVQRGEEIAEIRK